MLESFDPLYVFLPGAALIFAKGIWYGHGFRRQEEPDETGHDPAAR